MIKIKQIILKISSVFLLAVFPLVSVAQVNPNFNADKLIEDKIFEDTQTFGGPEGIQKFLEVKNSVLANTSLDFLVKLKEPDSVTLKQGLEDPQPNLSRLRTAAELIWDAAKQSGLNPQVILVTLNKEQGLITSANDFDPARLQKALDRSMGFDCPDSGGCGNLFPGFYYQLFGNYDSENNRYLGAAKSLMKSFSTPNGRGPVFNGQVSRVGDVITLDNTPSQIYNPPAQQTVTLFNRATAALYRYTPHVFNGNYNFWKFFNEWFRYPNGTILKLATGVDYYIIQNGVKQLIPQFVAVSRGLNLNNSLIASPNEFESYSTDKVLGPVDNTIVTVIGEGTKFVFDKNIKHPASEFVIKQRGLDPNKVLSITAQESALFEKGPVLTPSEGTILRGVTDQTVYLVENSRLKTFSAFTFNQRKIKASNVITVPDAEVASYEKLGFVPPLDGTLVKPEDSGTIYLMEQGLKRPLSAETFKNRGLSFKNVTTLSKDEVGALTIGAFATPKEKTWLADSKTGQQYLFKDGSLHSISSYVAKSRVITPDYFFSPGEIGEWQQGIPYPPKNGTLISGDKDQTVYYVQNGQLKPITYNAFKARRYSFAKVVKLPQEEVNAYAKGETITK